MQTIPGTFVCCMPLRLLCMAVHCCQVAEVRWYTFQFLMEELAEALECLHVKLHRLSQGLPDPAIQLQVSQNHRQEKDLM